MQLGYPSRWDESKTRALQAFQMDAPNAPAPAEETLPHLPTDGQRFCPLPCWLLPATTSTPADVAAGAAWAHQGCPALWPGASGAEQG